MPHDTIITWGLVEKVKLMCPSLCFSLYQTVFITYRMSYLVLKSDSDFGGESVFTMIIEINFSGDLLLFYNIKKEFILSNEKESRKAI